MKDTNENCQQDALIALQALPPGVAIPNKMLLPEICFKFLDQSWRKETRNAAIGLLFLAVKEGVVRADTFVQTEGAMEASLSWLRQNMEKPGSQEDVAKAAFAILKMAADEYEEFVRLRIEVADLKILIGWVQQRGTEDLKELLTNALVLILESGTANKVHFAFVKVTLISILHKVRTVICKHCDIRGRSLFFDYFEGPKTLSYYIYTWYY